MDGVQVAVASFGRRDVIYKAIASAVGTELADTVYITTPGDFDGYVVAGLHVYVCVRVRVRACFFFQKRRRTRYILSYQSLSRSI